MFQLSAYPEHRSVFKVASLPSQNFLGVALKKPEEVPQMRTVRADAQRNEDAVIAAARGVFATAGVDAPVRLIAEQAGVGIGTLYRRFPTRADLIAAVFRHEVDACVADAVRLCSSECPADALRLWLHRYTAFIATKRGLAAALHSGDPAYDGLPAYFRAQFEPTLQNLLDTALKAGAIRPGVAAFDLLRAIGNLSSAQGPDAADHAKRMVDLLVDGLGVRI